MLVVLSFMFCQSTLQSARPRSFGSGSSSSRAEGPQCRERPVAEGVLARPRLGQLSHTHDDVGSVEYASLLMVDESCTELAVSKVDLRLALNAKPE